MLSRFRQEIEKLHPAYFGLVMATGIISISGKFMGWPFLPEYLSWVNVIAYCTLGVMNSLRCIYFPHRVLTDFSSHSRGVGFFTFVAATCVLAAQLVVVYDWLMWARALWYLGAATWLFFMYGIFLALTVKQEKPSLAEGIDGGWLVSVVASQSLCVLGCLVNPELGIGTEGSLTLMLSLWLCGGMLYIWLISLIFYRYTFFVLHPSDLMPPYWINMGAMAISTLAGAMLIQRAPDSPLLMSILPFLKGFSLWYWATATWWIPLMVSLAFWRHGIRKFPFAYDQGHWGVVFPLGMYTACTFQLGRAVDSDLIASIPRGFVFISTAAWCVIFAMFLHRLARVLLKFFRR